jgi:hypothetical protein
MLGDLVESGARDAAATVVALPYPGVAHALPEALLLDWKTDLSTLLRDGAEDNN